MPCARLSVQVRPGQGAGPLGRTVSESLDHSVFNITIWNMSVHETWKCEHSAMLCRGETKVRVLVLSLSFVNRHRTLGMTHQQWRQARVERLESRSTDFFLLRERKITLRKPQTRMHK